MEMEAPPIIVTFLNMENASIHAASVGVIHQDLEMIFIDNVTPIICEAECGSPCYGFRLGMNPERIMCGGCEHIQSEKYSSEILSKNFLPPILTDAGQWLDPGDGPEYFECLDIMLHPFIKIQNISLTRRLKVQMAKRIYI